VVSETCTVSPVGITKVNANGNIQIEVIANLNCVVSAISVQNCNGVSS